MVQYVHTNLNNIKNNKIQSHKFTAWLYNKGWSYYNYQLKTFSEIEEGNDVLVTSPTGSGKTIAGFLPSIINSNCFQKDVLYTLYISPLKSLSYDIERNLLKPILDLNLNISISVRTGDTSSYKKSIQLKKPPNILITTPESFALLMSYKGACKFFKSLKYVVIDELHNLIHTKRGDLLTLNLARLDDFCPKVLKIGLSATINDLNTGLNYITNRKESRIVKNKEKKKLLVSILNTKKEIPWSGYMPTYAIKDIYKKILFNKSTIIFVNTRAQAEYVFQNLWKINNKKISIAVHHGSLEKKLRQKVEKKMYAGLINCVVATSSLELGIDWGNIDLVIQIGAPKGIARIIQRIGRCNHKIDTPSNAILIPTNKFEYLECEAAKKAIIDYEIEDKKIKEGSLDVLAQHLVGVACSNPFKENILYNNIIKAFPYKKLKLKTFIEILTFVKNGGYSLKNYNEFSKIKKNIDGYYTISSKKYVNKYRMNVGTIVESELISIFLKNRKLGQIEEYFINNLKKGDTFLFAGKVLEFVETNLKGVKVQKSSKKNPKIPSFSGGKLPLSSKLAVRVLNLINNYKKENIPNQISHWLQQQEKYSILPSNSNLLVETFSRKFKSYNKNYLIAYTFQGRAANQTLGIMLLERLITLKLEPIAFTATDYALAIWSSKAIENINLLFNIKELIKNIDTWINSTSLIRRHFKNVAIISGLIDKNYPGYVKTNKQIRFNSDLIFEVLNKYEKEHILLKSTRAETMNELIDYYKVCKYLSNIKSNIIHKKLSKVSPLSIPLLLEFNIEKVRDDFLIDNMEQESFLLKEASLIK